MQRWCCNAQANREVILLSTNLARVGASHFAEKRLRRLGDNREATEFVAHGLDGLVLVHADGKELVAQRDVADTQGVAELEDHCLRRGVKC